MSDIDYKSSTVKNLGLSQKLKDRILSYPPSHCYIVNWFKSHIMKNSMDIQQDFNLIKHKPLRSRGTKLDYAFYPTYHSNHPCPLASNEEFGTRMRRDRSTLTIATFSDLSNPIKP